MLWRQGIRLKKLPDPQSAKSERTECISPQYVGTSSDSDFYPGLYMATGPAKRVKTSPPKPSVIKERSHSPPLPRMATLAKGAKEGDFSMMKIKKSIPS